MFFLKFFSSKFSEKTIWSFTFWDSHYIGNRKLVANLKLTFKSLKANIKFEINILERHQRT